MAVRRRGTAHVGSRDWPPYNSPPIARRAAAEGSVLGWRRPSGQAPPRTSTAPAPALPWRPRQDLGSGRTRHRTPPERAGHFQGGCADAESGALRVLRPPRAELHPSAPRPDTPGSQEAGRLPRDSLARLAWRRQRRACTRRRSAGAALTATLRKCTFRMCDGIRPATDVYLGDDTTARPVVHAPG
jgi:hypothetical protein